MCCPDKTRARGGNPWSARYSLKLADTIRGHAWIVYDGALNKRWHRDNARREPRNQPTTDNAAPSAASNMKRETLVFTVCGFLLGLTIGGLVIGPKIAQSRLAGAPAPSVASTMAEPSTPPVAAGSPMAAVQQKLATLKDAIAKDPKDFDALVQLGDMYMDAAKFPQAIDYLDRAIAARDDANVRTDLGICYKQAGQPGRALAEFERAASMAPDQWQPLFNEAIVLVDLHRMDEAREVGAKLQKMQPQEPEVQKLLASLAGKQ